MVVVMNPLQEYLQHQTLPRVVYSYTDDDGTDIRVVARFDEPECIRIITESCDHDLLGAPAWTTVQKGYPIYTGDTSVPETHLLQAATAAWLGALDRNMHVHFDDVVERLRDTQVIIDAIPDKVRFVAHVSKGLIVVELEHAYTDSMGVISWERRDRGYRLNVMASQGPKEMSILALIDAVLFNLAGATVPATTDAVISIDPVARFA
jgi:hypothetical protein